MHLAIKVAFLWNLMVTRHFTILAPSVIDITELLFIIMLYKNIWIMFLFEFMMLVTSSLVQLRFVRWRQTFFGALVGSFVGKTFNGYMNGQFWASRLRSDNGLTSLVKREDLHFIVIICSFSAECMFSVISYAVNPFWDPLNASPVLLYYMWKRQ